MTNLIVTAALVLGAMFWLDSLRAREHALGISNRACTRHDLQLLDQTVALRALSLAWRADGLKWRRTYEFEFSAEGITRQTARLVLRGLELERIDMNVCEIAP